ncbi:MAG: CHAD domain-containing protein [Betaproteobacteria bacterium]
MTAKRRPAGASLSHSAPVPIETELKLALDPDAASRLPRHPALKALKRGRARTTRLVATYFDTHDCDLAASGVALRLRRDGRRVVQTIKGPARSDSVVGMAIRAEYEWPVPAGRLDPLRFATTPFRRVLAKAEKRGLEARFVTDYRRTTIPLTFPDSTMAVLCIDIGEVRSHDGGPVVRRPIHEIELELEAGDPLRLFDLARTLAIDMPLALARSSKAERGYQLRDPVVAAPLRASDAILAEDITASDAFAAIIRSCLTQIEGNATGLCTDGDPEWVHQMRIGVRRLRACLALGGAAFPAARLDPLRVELRWLAHALGPARDLDVFVTATLPAFKTALARGSGAGPLDRALRSLVARARRQRTAARAAARAAVASPRFVQLMLGAGALAATPLAHADESASALDLLTGTARDFARPLLKRRHRKLLALGHDLAHAEPAARHAARLAAKKLRYATEFFAPLFPRKRTRDYRRALAALQEELGLWNDAAVAARLAADIAGAESAVAAAFSGAAAAAGAARERALTQAWHDFVAASTFWARR